VWTLISSIAAFAQRVEILSAYYGIGNYRVDVTERVQRLASNGESFEVSSRNLGLPSVPIPGKQLTVVYSIGRRQFRESAQEGESIRFKEVLGVKAAPIEYRSEGKRRSLRLGNVGDVEIEGLAGQDGSDVTIGNHPFTAVPGFPAVVAKSKQMRFSDYGLKWEVSNKNGFFSPFAYQSA